MIIVSDLLPRFSTVPKRTLREKVSRKGILLTNMMSAMSVTDRYRAIIWTGRVAAWAIRVACGAWCTVFPFRDTTSGPNMSSGDWTIGEELAVNQLLRAWSSHGDLELPSYHSMCVVSNHVLMFIVGYGAYHDDAFHHLRDVEALGQDEVAYISVRLCQRELLFLLAEVNLHSWHFGHVAEREDVGDAVGVVPHGSVSLEVPFKVGD